MEKVIIYSTSWCNYCHSLMDWLDKVEVEYEERDVEADEKFMAELVEKNGDNWSVPVTVIGEEVIEGFDRPAIKAALKKYGVI